MAEHNDLGRKGEDIALEYLQKKGYIILATNWKSNRHEIDIVAKDNGFLVIIEVKTRQSDFFSLPEEAVNKQKQKTLINAARAYIYQRNINLDTRFDIISILISQEKVDLNHIQHAFYPTVR